MIIYIYGSDAFKKEIHSVLNHSNIKFRLDEHGEIKDLNTLEQLKEAIEENPNNIYLIDDDKIIKKNSLNKKIKFLTPKDGIEQEYLLDHGIGDVSVDSIEELSKHIIKRLESVIHDEEASDIQDSIVEIVENAYEDEEEKNYVQLDDELSALLSHENIEEDSVDSNENFDQISSLVTQIDDVNLEEEDVSNLEDLSFDEDLDTIIDSTNTVNENYESVDPLIEENIDTLITEDISQGDGMADEFSEFDTLNEDDILAALNNLDSVSAPVQTKQNSSVSASEVSPSSNESIDVSSSNVNDIAELISKLLNNKTLEITVKVKD